MVAGGSLAAALAFFGFYFYSPPYVKNMFCMWLQETFVIEDCNYYDISSSSNISNYSIPSGMSFTFDTDHYIMTNNSDNWKSITVSPITDIPSNFKLEYDIYISNTVSNSQNELAISDSNGTNGYYIHIAPIDNRYGVYVMNGGSSSAYYTTYSSFTKNKWYHVEFSYDNGTFIVKIYDGDNVVVNLTQSNITSYNCTKLTIRHGWARNAVSNIKNIKIKAL